MKEYDIRPQTFNKSSKTASAMKLQQQLTSKVKKILEADHQWICTLVLHIVASET